jgi:hypothetical protein
MNFDQWWDTLTIKEQTVIGKNNARFVWGQACGACEEECKQAHQRFKELWNRFDYPEDEGRMDAAGQCAAACKKLGESK